MEITKTFVHISKYFWARDLIGQIAQWANDCVLCQRAKQAQANRIDHQASEIPTSPFKIIFIYYIGRCIF